MSATIADVRIVGVGGLGGIMAKELASAGLKAVGFERGSAPEHEYYAPRDSIRLLIRPERLEWVRHEPTTTRSKAGQKPRLQDRTSPLNVLGGALLHWTGQSSRYAPDDFKLFSREIESGNADAAISRDAGIRLARGLIFQAYESLAGDPKSGIGAGMRKGVAPDLP